MSGARETDVLIVGGGMAGANCARWLRELGFDGRVLLAGRELDPPYNRPPCSKGYLQRTEDREATLFRPDGWWAEQDIDLHTRTSVAKLDLDARVATLSSREQVRFDRALLATGALVRRLPVEGSELEGIHYLRTLGNADRIAQDAADAERAVLVGGSYIASEVAASLTVLGCRCSMLMLEHTPLSRGFGDQAGRHFARVLSEHGVEVHGGQELDRFEGDGDRVRRVVTKQGLELDADLVVIGAGVTPDVALARAAGLEIGEAGGVVTDSGLRSSAPGIFAAGDIAEYDSPIHGRRVRIEHWDVAFQHGKTAAHNMLDRDVEHREVPYFFSDLADWASIEYVGTATSWDREIVRGSLDDGEFSLWYLREGRVGGALSVGRSEDLAAARRLLVDGADLGDRADALGDLDSDLGEL